MRKVLIAICLLVASPALAQPYRAALIDNASGKVVNVVEANASDKAPKGFTLVPSNSADIGDGWDGSKIVPKPQPVDPRRGQ